MDSLLDTVDVGLVDVDLIALESLLNFYSLFSWPSYAYNDWTIAAIPQYDPLRRNLSVGRAVEASASELKRQKEILA